jgi:serine/threonine-protein kinase SRPK3
MKIRPDIAQRLSLEVATGLAEIHKAGIIYNDFTPGNVSLQLEDTVGTMSAERLYERLGHPQGMMLTDMPTNEEGESRAPTQVYACLDFRHVDNIGLMKPAIKFVDFAEIRFIDESPSDASHGLTLLYADPETLYCRSTQDQAADLWSLACIIFELRASETLVHC